MPTPRESLLTMLARKSFRLGQFKLSAGGTSDYYIDCRATTLDAEGARLTARVFLDEIYRQRWTAVAIGGLTLGADPIVATVAMLSAQQVQDRSHRTTDEGIAPGGLMHGFLVRKAEKAHGTAQRIEGFHERAAHVVIVDDVCTTGASTIQAIYAAREFGMHVVGVMCLVEREDARGRPNVEQAADPAKFVSLYTAREIREQHLRLRGIG